MPIMAARVYHDGKLVRDLGPDEAIPEDCDPGDFFWLGLYEPTPDELAGIARRFGLHPLAVEDALKANQLPKVETYGDQLFLITRTANLDGDTIQPGETAFFVGPHFFVSVRHGSARTHKPARGPARRAHLNVADACSARKQASAAVRRRRLSRLLHSSTWWKNCPYGPRPSITGTPSAASRFASEPPPWSGHSPT